MAEKQPKRDLKEKADLFIAEWQEKYGHALDNARAAAATTQTPAWQENYQRNMREHRKVETDNCGWIEGAVKVILDSGSTEDREKAVKDYLKALAEERESHTAWRVKAVNPYKVAAENCGEMVMSCIAAAQRSEDAMPLVDRGLVEEVRKRVAKWPVAKWDDERGVAEIIDRQTGEVSEAA